MEISLFSNEKNKQMYGTCDHMQNSNASNNCRDHSEATSTSVGPPLRKGCLNCKSCSNNKSGAAASSCIQSGPQMINISPIKQSIIKYCNQVNGPKPSSTMAPASATQQPPQSIHSDPKKAAVAVDTQEFKE